MVVFEDFTSYANGAITNTEWEEKIKPTSGTSLALINTLSNSPSGKALVIMATTTAGSRVYAYKPLNGVTDLESLVLFSVVPTGGLSGRQGGLYNRYSGIDEASTKGYVVNFTPNDTSTRAIWLVDDSNPTPLGQKPFSWVNTTRYWHRLSTFGNQIKSKTWEYGTPEPSSWDFEVTDNNTTTGDYNGVGTYATGTVSIMQYSANTDGTAPMNKPQEPSPAPDPYPSELQFVSMQKLIPFTMDQSQLNADDRLGPIPDDGLVPINRESLTYSNDSWLNNTPIKS